MTAKIRQTIGTQGQWLYFEECVESLVFETEEVKLYTLERPFLLNGWLTSTWDFMGFAVEQLR